MNLDLDVFINKFLTEAVGHLQKEGMERQTFFDDFLSENFNSLHLVKLSDEKFNFKSSALISSEEGRVIIFNNENNPDYLFLKCVKEKQVWKVESLLSICLGCFGSGILVDSICTVCYGCGWTNF